MLLMAGASLPQAHAQAPKYAQPSGVYAKVDIEDAKKGCPGYQDGTADFHSCLHKLYEKLFLNTAISGLTVGERWDNIQISSTGCFDPIPENCFLASTDWFYLDDAFAVAKAHGGTVQLIITPGVDTPLWVLVQIPSCDGLLVSNGTSQPGCGKVSIQNFQQQQRADGTVLPLPWNAVYRTQWNSFLGLLKDRYNSNSNPAFVSIAVARPNCASDEIILPTSAYGSSMGPLPGVAADTAWPVLIQNSFPDGDSTHWNSDQAFVDAWTQTIDDYEAIFFGVTLALSPDAGNYLPELQTTILNQALYNLDCASAAYPFSCAAKTDILSYFLYNYTDGPNAKATQVGGMTASSPVTAKNSKLGIGIGGVKLLTVVQPSLPPPAPPPVLGGAEFDHPVSTGNNIQKVGCPTATCTPPVTTEEAAYDVLTVFFHGTPAAAYYGGLTMGVGMGGCGSAPIQYLEAPYEDILNAWTLPPPTTASRIPGLGTTSLEDLLNRASQDLLAMAGQGTIAPPLCP
jgi:hypothetical protein